MPVIEWKYVFADGNGITIMTGTAGTGAQPGFMVCTQAGATTALDLHTPQVFSFTGAISGNVLIAPMATDAAPAKGAVHGLIDEHLARRVEVMTDKAIFAHEREVPVHQIGTPVRAVLQRDIGTEIKIAVTFLTAIVGWGGKEGAAYSQEKERHPGKAKPL